MFNYAFGNKFRYLRQQLTERDETYTRIIIRDMIRSTRKHGDGHQRLFTPRYLPVPKDQGIESEDTELSE